MRLGMETITKPALRASDRLSQTVSALARLLDQTMNEIQVLDNEFQEQLEETDQNARLVVTTELEDRFNQQLAQFEATRNELITERSQLTQQLEQLRDAAAEWEEERARLVGDCERLNHLLDQGKKEYDRALAATDEAAALALERQVANAVERVRGDLTTKWDAERAKLIAERNRAQQRLADVAADYEGQVAESVNDVRSELTKEIDGLRRELEQARRSATSAAAVPAAVPPEANTIHSEITRVEGLIESISKIVEDPETELTVVIRKNVERAELESYLRGLRFKMTGN
jgi:chromosome segregation ATPase